MLDDGKKKKKMDKKHSIFDVRLWIYLTTKTAPTTEGLT